MVSFQEDIVAKYGRKEGRLEDRPPAIAVA